MEALAIFLNPFIVCSSCKSMLVVCRFLRKNKCNLSVCKWTKRTKRTKSKRFFNSVHSSLSGWREGAMSASPTRCSCRSGTRLTATTPSPISCGSRTASHGMGPLKRLRDWKEKQIIVFKEYYQTCSIL